MNINELGRQATACWLVACWHVGFDKGRRRLRSPRVTWPIDQQQSRWLPAICWSRR